ncbi:hypothetical protein CDAR_83831 [Caerostris darwini]|uniref:Uncharacterized protein n=1 Tax=Caerostris darwini TaxID=1538125 RepID=A0AAV4U3F4_9ARAC|nr:hypothetical protein CDAR_83831 [Caerostris darwini]
MQVIGTCLLLNKCAFYYATRSLFSAVWKRRKEGKTERKNEGKKERRKEGKKVGKKDRKKERKLERRKERKTRRVDGDCNILYCLTLKLLDER